MGITVPKQLFEKLTSKKIEEFNNSWSSFIFNLEELKLMKLLKINDIEKVLSAGSRFLGCGWSPERARKRLYELSGCLVVEPNFTTYLQIWLLTTALVTDCALPPLNLSQEAAAAAFAVAAAHDSREPSGRNRGATQGAPLNLPWDEPTVQLNRKLQVLWQRAERGEYPISFHSLQQTMP